MTSIPQKLKESYSSEYWNPYLEALRTFHKNSETSAEEFLHAVETFSPDQEWKREDVVNAMQEFDELGLAKFTKGARGKPTRVKWLSSPEAIADAALGDAEVLLSELLDTETAIDPSITTAYRGKRTWEMKEIMHVLEVLTGLPGEHITIQLKIPEAKEIFAKCQGISTQEVMINLG